MYLGKNSELAGTAEACSIDVSSYPTLSTFMTTLAKESREVFSDGERAILLILRNLSYLQDGKILIIDELLSRIYEDAETPLRSEVSNLIKIKSHEHNSITIVVDHAIKIPEAVQLKMTKPANITFC